MLILLDQDGVLADFDRGFHAAWNALGHSHPALPPSQRSSFYVRDDYPAHLRELVEEIYTTPGFFRDLLPIDGALGAIQEILSLGHDIRICTSPLNQYRNCVQEKYEWVEQHLGLEFVSRMIVSKDKTLVHGDVLVDDKPKISGVRTPDWRHIVYDQPYNRSVGAPRMTWDNWREILLNL